MSDPIAKAERSKAKDERQMPAPDDKPKRKPGKKGKPWRVDYKWKAGHGFFKVPGGSDWTKFGAYRTQEESCVAVGKDRRKYDCFEYRLIGHDGVVREVE